MNFLSVCSGIEAASVAWHPLGWRAAAFAEIEKFPCAVLNHHYPDVPNYGDMTKFKDWPDAAINLLVGGTPCQSFSVAGLRAGLADPRGNLALTYLGIADRYRPEWLLWENVPGVLSADGGRAFGSILRGMAELGYGWAYRVLDAQYVRVDGFGRAVPQRRRRVFVVGNSRGWRRSAAVLFEPESLSGDTAPRRETGQRVAGTLSARPTGGGGLGTDFDLDGGLVPQISHCLNAGGMGRQDYETETLGAHALRAEGFDASEDGTGRGTPLVPIAIQERAVCENPDAGPDGAGIRTDGVAYTLEARTVPQAIAFDARQSDVIQYGDKTGPLDTDGHTMAVAYDLRGREDGSQFEGPHETANIRAASGGSSRSYVAQQWAVRRLTPVECERLQGFPAGYTDVPYGRKNWTPDGPRYKALGNSMAVNAMRWLGTRISMVQHFDNSVSLKQGE